MKKEWNVQTAVKALSRSTVNVNERLKIITTAGLSGLMACSAKDYLIHHAGYTVVTSEVFEAKVHAMQQEDAKMRAEAKKAKQVENAQAIKAKQQHDKKANKQRKNFNKAKQANVK